MEADAISVDDDPSVGSKGFRLEDKPQRPPRLRPEDPEQRGWKEL